MANCTRARVWHPSSSTQPRNDDILSTQQFFLLGVSALSSTHDLTLSAGLQEARPACRKPAPIIPVVVFWGSSPTYRNSGQERNIYTKLKNTQSVQWQVVC